MVGGFVVEVIEQGSKTWINVEDGKNGDRCAIYVKTSDDTTKIAFGDNIWWQGSGAYWTPRNRSIIDKRLDRIGYSGVSKPRILN
jgi:hypothetical protein